MATKQKFLTKACKCSYCGEPMAAGEAFEWRKKIVQRATYALGSGSGMLQNVEQFKPCHPFDCMTAKYEQSCRDRYHAGVKQTLDCAAKWGATLSAEEIEKIKAEWRAQCGLKEGEI